MQSPADSPLIELRRKDERIARDERKTMVPYFWVLGHLVTSEVRSITRNH